MTLLAPEIVEAILAGNQPAGLTMAKAMHPFPMEWTNQRAQLSEPILPHSLNSITSRLTVRHSTWAEVPDAFVLTIEATARQSAPNPQQENSRRGKSVTTSAPTLVTTTVSEITTTNLGGT